MKNRNAIKFFAVLVVVVFCTYLMLCGLKMGDKTIIKGFKDIRTGIDIRGGVSAQIAPKDTDLADVTEDDVDSAKALIEKRLDDVNIFDAVVTPEYEKKRIYLEIPWAAGETEYDAQALVDETIQMTKLTFYEVEPYMESVQLGDSSNEDDKKADKKNKKSKKADKAKAAATVEPQIEATEEPEVKATEEPEADSSEDAAKDKSSKKDKEDSKKENAKDTESGPKVYTELGGQGEYTRIGDEIMTGEDVEHAAAVSQDGETVVSIDLESGGRKKFASATAEISSKNGMIGIFMDDTLISAATVEETIDSESCIIRSDEFNKDKEQAKTLADRINAGGMPFEMEAVEINTISATMGDSAYTVTQWALVISLLLIMIYLIAMYRVLGVVASIALLGHTAVNILVISNFGITLTLPGIAGVILSIGMAVDGNCVIFERVKDELRAGRTLRSSIDAGFKSAFSAVFDGNVTTIICCAVLYFFGTGAIKSFALTTIVGVALSFISAITASRWMILGTIDLNIATNKTWYGITEKSMARFNRKQEALGLVSSGDKKKKR